MLVRDRVLALRKLLDDENIDVYIIPTDDFHNSEYVGDYFKSRAFITGFTGSAGTAIVTGSNVFGFPEKAGLWVDGRYFLQGEKQLEGTGIKLFKMGEPGVPTLPELLSKILNDKSKIGFDGRTVSANLVNEIACAGKKCEKTFSFVSMDIVGKIWKNRPELSCSIAEDYPVCFAGESRECKLAALSMKLKEMKGDMFVLTALDDIAWLLNMRGNDVKCTPVVLSYFVMDADKPILFIQEKATELLAEDFMNLGIELRPYNEIYCYLAQHTTGKKVIADLKHINYDILTAVSKNAELINIENYKLIPKAVKNSVELANMRKAHLRDGVAKVKWLYWLKNNVGKVNIDEISAAEELSRLRRLMENNRGDSFTSIIGYKEHGAIIHYSATEESKSQLMPEGMVLADTGGQYLDGTTDVTRTIVLGPISDEEKRSYTAVLCGHLELGDAKFPYGTEGSELDGLAREPLAKIGLSYNHGTGHGVGMYLNVHEDPVRITKASAMQNRHVVFEEGMITSNEPGAYIPGEYGIRIENLMICRKQECDCCDDQKNMMYFETLTLVPYDRAAVLPEEMSERQKALYNRYQQRVYDKISPFLSEEEAAWLKLETAPI